MVILLTIWIQFLKLFLYVCVKYACIYKVVALQVRELYPYLDPFIFRITTYLMCNSKCPKVIWVFSHSLFTILVLSYKDDRHS